MKLYIILSCLFTLPLSIRAQDNYSSNISPEHVENNKWDNEVSAFEGWDKKNSFPKDAVLFIGSSSIRLWSTRQAFGNFPVINRGFGGAHISDVIHFHKRIIIPYNPSIIVFFAGGNDINAGKSPLEVMNDFKSLSQIVLDELPKSEMIVLSIKPSPLRQKLWPSCMQANKYISDFCSYEPRLNFIDVSSCLLNDDGNANKNLYDKDMLHLNDKGYEKWISILTPVLKKHYSQKNKEQDNDKSATHVDPDIVYLASKNSKIFHRSDCSSTKRIAQKNLIKFTTRQQAIDSGRRACKTCKP